MADCGDVLPGEHRGLLIIARSGRPRRDGRSARSASPPSRGVTRVSGWLGPSACRRLRARRRRARRPHRACRAARSARPDLLRGQGVGMITRGGGAGGRRAPGRPSPSPPRNGRWRPISQASRWPACRSDRRQAPGAGWPAPSGTAARPRCTGPSSRSPGPGSDGRPRCADRSAKQPAVRRVLFVCTAIPPAHT